MGERKGENKHRTSASRLGTDLGNGARPEHGTCFAFNRHILDSTRLTVAPIVIPNPNTGRWLQ